MQPPHGTLRYKILIRPANLHTSSPTQRKAPQTAPTPTRHKLPVKLPRIQPRSLPALLGPKHTLRHKTPCHKPSLRPRTPRPLHHRSIAQPPSASVHILRTHTQPPELTPRRPHPKPAATPLGHRRQFKCIEQILLTGHMTRNRSPSNDIASLRQRHRRAAHTAHTHRPTLNPHAIVQPIRPTKTTGHQSLPVPAQIAAPQSSLHGTPTTTETNTENPHHPRHRRALHTRVHKSKLHQKRQRQPLRRFLRPQSLRAKRGIDINSLLTLPHSKKIKENPAAGVCGVGGSGVKPLDSLFLSFHSLPTLQNYNPSPAHTIPPSPQLLTTLKYLSDPLNPQQHTLQHTSQHTFQSFTNVSPFTISNHNNLINNILKVNYISDAKLQIKNHTRGVACNKSEEKTIRFRMRVLGG